jgi:hypothetical protein
MATRRIFTLASYTPYTTNLPPLRTKLRHLSRTEGAPVASTTMSKPCGLADWRADRAASASEVGIVVYVSAMSSFCARSSFGPG